VSRVDAACIWGNPYARSSVVVWFRMTNGELTSTPANSRRRNELIALVPFVAMALPLGFVIAQLEDILAMWIFVFYLVGGLPAVMLAVVMPRLLKKRK